LATARRHSYPSPLDGGDAAAASDRWDRHDWWGVVLDAPDVAVLAKFYSELRGWAVYHQDDDDASLDLGEGVAYLSNQRNEDYVRPVWPARQPAPINLGFAGQCISLGRRAGIFQFAYKDDTAKRFYLGDRPGAKLKEFVCKHTVTQLADEARKPGSRTWAKDDKRQQLLQAKRGEAADA